MAAKLHDYRYGGVFVCYLRSAAQTVGRVAGSQTPVRLLFVFQLLTADS